MTEPDELYTLRAQYWLGHYHMALEEAKSIARRPMNPNLKAEREEFLARAWIAQGHYDRVTATETPGKSLQNTEFRTFLHAHINSVASGITWNLFAGLQALALKAQYEAATGNTAAQESILNQIKSLAAGGEASSVGLTAAQVLLVAGQTKEALQLVHASSRMEDMLVCLQIYLKLDRLDLAKKSLQKLKQKDEDSILCQLAGVYVHLASGSEGSADAVHSINSLTEQYGSSPLLANLMACALLQQGDYAGAEQALEECLREQSEIRLPDTLINMICATTHQNKSADQYVGQMQLEFPAHPFCAGLERVTAAFEREAIKYKV
jgi:tetratricopeptide (TPR) repeat protein